MLKHRRPRILFVCYADSVHSQSWINLLQDSEFDVRVFTTYMHSSNDRYTLPWRFPTYSVVRPNTKQRITGEVMWLLPNPPRFKTVLNWVRDRFSLRDRWLRRIILTWQPDIVHSLPIDTGGKPALRAMRQIPRIKRSKWVVSAWGSDLYLGMEEADTRERIIAILNDCDGFMADCLRDIHLAVELGLPTEKLAFSEPTPGSGGLDIMYFHEIRERKVKRDVILIPKAFDRWLANRILPTIEALCLIEDSLEGYEIHLLMCSRAVKVWLQKLPSSLRERCFCHDMLPQKDFFALLGRSRVMVATSLSDGTPNVMLEAMAAGALPIMSPIEPVKEWINNGTNGLLAHALHPEQIASALKRALADNQLIETASRMNLDLIQQRANREDVKKKVLSYYRNLVS